MRKSDNSGERKALPAVMLVENIPDLANLDAEQKLILARELWNSERTPVVDSLEPSREAVRMLEERLALFEANRETGISWEDLRDRKLAEQWLSFTFAGGFGAVEAEFQPPLASYRNSQ